MKVNSFVTLYDKGYLSRGIALYQSLCKWCKRYDFKLYILAMDDSVKDYWRNCKTESVTVFTVDDICRLFPVVDQLRRNRKHNEFCWTCSSFAIKYVFRVYSPVSLTYIDSDVYFYEDPDVLLEEIENESVMITAHNYTSRYDQTYLNGKFCVQFMFFRNNDDGREILEWWNEKCIENCTIDYEKGLCGDQKYLDDWEHRYSGKVHVCRNPGCGIAPWNLQQFQVSEIGDDVYITDCVSKVKSKLVFFHFHSLSKIGLGKWFLSNYDTREDFKEIIYDKYIRTIEEIEGREKEACSDFVSLEESLLFRIFPLPYISQRYLSYMVIEKDNMITFTNDEGCRCDISYIIEGDSSHYIKILSLSNKEFFYKYYNEIIWRMELALIYTKCKDENEAVVDIYQRFIKGEKIMIECMDSIIEFSNLCYPYFVKKKILIIDKNGNSRKFELSGERVENNIINIK